MARAPKSVKQVGTLNHPENRVNIPTAEMADLAAMQEEMQPLAPAPYARARPLAEPYVGTTYKHALKISRLLACCCKHQEARRQYAIDICANDA